MAPATLSEGLSTKVLPHVIAKGNIHNGHIAGKLKGATPAHTPNGTLKEYVSIPFEILLIVSPEIM